MALLGPLIEEAEGAIIISDADMAFGCMGCARTNELVKFLVRQRNDIPLLDIRYPSNEDDGLAFVSEIKNFLENIPGEKSEDKK